MDREAIEDMLETMLIGDSDQRKLRRLLVDYEREMQRLRKENAWLKKVLEDCEKKRVDEKSGRVVDMTKPQPCVRYLKQHFNKDKSLYLVGRCLAQVDRERKECLEALVICFADRGDEAKEHLAEELTDVKTAATTALHVLGYDEVARGKLQERVNEKNKARGYWG
ncbi:hypothetical protein [uncultured Selenomonas sp.]|uniref:hypothetical protein n=1 Tax=uncultured Selenomonas sp. TaxID=159275 RepID=UPI00261978D0|nr:hypothetical protein [uncultured Selenomonas sp.]